MTAIPNTFANQGAGNPAPPPGVVSTPAAQLDENFDYVQQYTALATGADTRTINAKLTDLVSVKDFGAAGDGVTDDTASIQAAVTFAEGIGAGVYFPAGTYFKPESVTITQGVALVAWPGSVFFTWTSPTLQSFIVNTTSPCAFVGLNFTGVGSAGGATGGAAITFTAPGSGNNALNFQSVVRDCQFVNQYLGIDTVNAAYWTIDRCIFNQYVFCGLRVQCLNQIDAGDSCLSNTIFDGLNTSSVGIIYTSSGGLKCSNVKMVTGSVGINVDLTNASSATGDLIWIGGSIEGMVTAAVQFERPAGSATFSHITITGLQIGLCGSGISVATPGVFANVNITGCDIAINATGDCISLVGVSNFTIAGNTLFANAGGSAGSGIVIDSQCTNGKIGVNSYQGLAVTLANSSTTTWSALDVQTASGSIAAAATAYGALFVSAGLAVVFPVPFTVAPTAGEINVSATAATAGPVGFLVESVTKTGFTLVAITALNAGTVSFAYSAAGII